MTVKRFFAENARDCLGKVKESLGPDAIVVSNKPAEGGVEIMAMSADSLDALSRSAAPPAHRPSKPGTPHFPPPKPALQSQSDPLQFMFGELPRVFAEGKDVDLTRSLGAIKEELESVLDRARVQASEVVRKTLDVGLDRREISLAETCQKWAKCFSIPDLQRAGSAQAVSFINRIEQRFDSDDLLLDSLAAQLVGQPTNRWDDGSLSRFDRALAEAVRTVEDEAVRLAVNGVSNPVIVNNLSRLIEARIRDLYENLGVLTGERRARESLLRLTKTSKEEAGNGNDSRSA